MTSTDLARVQFAFTTINQAGGIGDAVPVHPYPRDSWGPAEANRLLPAGDTWHEPAS